MSDCPNQPDLNDIKESLKLLAQTVGELAQSQKTILKYILVCICIIALGRTGIDLGKELLGKTAVGAVQAVTR